jgi:hypothetical protein
VFISPSSRIKIPVAPHDCAYFDDPSPSGAELRLSPLPCRRHSPSIAPFVARTARSCVGLPPWLLNHWGPSVWPIAALSHIQPAVGEDLWPVSAAPRPRAATSRRLSLAISSRCYSTPLHPLRRTIAVLRQPEHDLTYTFLSSNIITYLSPGKAKHSVLLPQHRRSDEETAAITTPYPEDTSCCFGAEDWASLVERVARMRWSPCLSSASSKVVRYDCSFDAMDWKGRELMMLRPGDIRSNQNYCTHQERSERTTTYTLRKAFKGRCRTRANGWER